jgi:hypothetical protein
MSKTHYVIKFGAKASSETPYGQKDTFPLENGSLAYGRRTFNGIGDRKGETAMNTTYFSVLDNNDTSFDQDIAQQLRAYLTQLVTTNMKPDTITILEVVTTDDSSNYKINSSIEHPEALIGEEDGVFTIVSDAATLSTIPEGGKEATNKTALDFKNRRVNAK